MGIRTTLEKYGLFGGDDLIRQFDAPSDSGRGTGAGAMDISDESGRFIVGYLHSHGGRVKQQTLLDARDWSAATVSRYLTRLEQEGYVERIPVGREKIVCLPECVPDSVSTPGRMGTGTA